MHGERGDRLGDQDRDVPVDAWRAHPALKG
jgi:hypothetical protein